MKGSNIAMLAPAVLLLIATVSFGPHMGSPERPRWVGVTVPSSEVEAGAEQPGVIESIPVKEGQRVRAGDLLFKLTSQLQELAVARLEALADSDVPLREARAELTHSEKELERYQDLYQKGIAGDQELDQRKREAELARIRLDRARVEQTVAVLRWKEAKARLAQRSVYSPVDGYVAQLLHSEGKAVEELDPIVTVVCLDPLWIEFDCPMEDARYFEEGTKLWVNQAGDPTKAAWAHVVHASMTADAASQTFRVRLQMENPAPKKPKGKTGEREPGREQWKTGLKVWIGLRGATGKSTPPTPPRGAGKR